jgi:hypothetical protein
MVGARVLAALVVAFAAVLSCSGPRGGTVRQSPAPEFSYITEEQLESAMWQLASGIESLQAILGSRKPMTQSQRVEVVGILDQMIAAADELGPSGISSNHPRITHNLGRFREKLEIARDSASMNPPRYYLVGNLSGTCLACHRDQQ